MAGIVGQRDAIADREYVQVGTHEAPKRVFRSTYDGLPNEEALRLHQRYRFGPKGLDVEQRVRLRELCRTGT
jgi:hypothetical protein